MDTGGATGPRAKHRVAAVMVPSTAVNLRGCARDGAVRKCLGDWLVHLQLCCRRRCPVR